MSASPPDDAQWREAMEQIHREAAGLVCVHLVKPSDEVDLVVAAMLGHQESAECLRVIAQAARQICEAPRRRPMLCLSCPRPIRKPGGVTFCIAVPDVDQPGIALTSAICPECGKAAAAKALRGLKRIWPELREIAITDPGGGPA